MFFIGGAIYAEQFIKKLNETFTYLVDVWPVIWILLLALLNLLKKLLRYNAFSGLLAVA